MFVETLVECLAKIAASAPKTPFYYYDINFMTGISCKLQFFVLASCSIVIVWQNFSAGGWLYVLSTILYFVDVIDIVLVDDH